MLIFCSFSTSYNWELILRRELVIVQWLSPHPRLSYEARRGKHETFRYDSVVPFVEGYVWISYLVCNAGETLPRDSWQRPSSVSHMGALTRRLTNNSAKYFSPKPTILRRRSGGDSLWCSRIQSLRKDSKNREEEPSSTMHSAAHDSKALDHLSPLMCSVVILQGHFT